MINHHFSQSRRGYQESRGERGKDPFSFLSRWESKNWKLSPKKSDRCLAWHRKISKRLRVTKVFITTWCNVRKKGRCCVLFGINNDLDVQRCVLEKQLKWSNKADRQSTSLSCTFGDKDGKMEGWDEIRWAWRTGEVQNSVCRILLTIMNKSSEQRKAGDSTTSTVN